MQEQEHLPVLVQEVLSWLEPRPGAKYLDATLGMGGHTLAIMQKARGRAQVLGLDQDMQALNQAVENIEQAGYRPQVHLAQARFSCFESVMSTLGWRLVDGVLLDLGVSSLQLDNAQRGFSYHLSGPLDMRMDQSRGVTANNILHKYRYEQLRRIILEYGQEPMAGRIARKIVQARRKRPIANTRELTQLVQEAYPVKWRRTSRKHPATKTFQALRIAVNQELQELEQFLRKIPAYLETKGRICVISFHSLEDRLVKNAFKQGDLESRMSLLTRSPIQPQPEELQNNRRSRSAKLRVAEKT